MKQPGGGNTTGERRGAAAVPGQPQIVPPVVLVPEPVHSESGPPAGGPPPAAPPRTRMPPVLVLLRPRQWVKNIFVLIAPLAVDPTAVLRNLAWASATVVAFTAASAAVYVLNDWLDREQDQLHPVKRHRPLASGKVGPLGALSLGTGCLATAAAVGALLPLPVQSALAGYALINLAYCLLLKHYPLVDVSLVATGFVLRATAGCLVVAAPFNPALLICVYCTCLLMSLGKRRHELETATRRGQAAAQRPALAGYSLPLLDQLIAVLLAATLITYELFLLSSPHPNSSVLAVVTVPFAVFALCRYAQLLVMERSGGEPGQDVLTDVPLLVNSSLWLACLTVG